MPHEYRVTNLNPSGTGSFINGLKYTGSDHRTIRFDVSGIIRCPEDSWFNPATSPAMIFGAQNITVRADDAPGLVTWTGSPMWLIDVRDVTFIGLTWALESPVVNNNNKANFWGPLRIIAESRTVERLTFRNCAMVGGEDENAVWYDPPYVPSDSNPNSRNLTFDSCFFGFGTQQWRGGPHNHTLNASFCDNLTFTRNFCAHNNRRNPQVEGVGSVISENVIYNYGTMAIGFYKGSHSVFSNLCVRGPQILGGDPVEAIQIAESDRTGTCTIFRAQNRQYDSGLLALQSVQAGTEEAVDVRNPSVTLVDQLLTGQPGFNVPSLAAVYRAGPFVNGLRSPYAELAVAQFEGCVPGGWVTTLADTGIPL